MAIIVKNKKTSFPPPVTLAALFVAVLVAIIVGGSALPVIASWWSSSKSDDAQSQNENASYPRVSETLKRDLDAARTGNLSLADGLTLVNNPFIDRSGVSSSDRKFSSSPSVNNPVSNFPRQPSNLQPAAFVQNYPKPAAPPIVMPNNSAIPITTPSPEGSSPDELKERLAERRRENITKKNSLRPISELYSVNDVVPLSVVGRGDRVNGRRDIRFYSAVTKQTFIASVGARFRDGVFTGGDDFSVTFKRDSGDSFSVKWFRINAGKNNDADDPAISVVPQKQ